jgi:hypothetical protein
MSKKDFIFKTVLCHIGCSVPLRLFEFKHLTKCRCLLCNCRYLTRIDYPNAGQQEKLEGEQTVLLRRFSRREKMKNPKGDMLCNNGTFSNDLRIQYEKDQIVLKTLLCTMMKKWRNWRKWVIRSPTARKPASPQAGRCK